MASPHSSEMLRSVLSRPGGVWSPPTIEYLAKKGGREPRAARTLAREPEWAMQLRSEDGSVEHPESGQRESLPGARRSGEHGGPIPRDGAPPSNLFEVLQSRMFYLPHTHSHEPEVDPSRSVHARYCCGIFADYIFPNEILRHGVYEGSYGQLVGDLKDLMQTLRRMCKKVQEKEVPPFVPPKELPTPMPTHVNMEILPLFVPPTLKELPEDPNLPQLEIAPFKPPRKIPLPIFVPPPEIKAKPFILDRPEGDEWDFLPKLDEDTLWKLRPKKPEPQSFLPPPARPMPEFREESINLRDMPRKPHYEPLPDAAALVQHLLKVMPPKLTPALLPLPCAAEYFVCDEDEAAELCDGMCGRVKCTGACRFPHRDASSSAPRGGIPPLGDNASFVFDDDSDDDSQADSSGVTYACGWPSGRGINPGRRSAHSARPQTPSPRPSSRQQEAVAQVDRMLAEKNASISSSAEMIKQRVLSFVKAETRPAGGEDSSKDGVEDGRKDGGKDGRTEGGEDSTEGMGGGDVTFRGESRGRLQASRAGDDRGDSAMVDVPKLGADRHEEGAEGVNGGLTASDADRLEGSVTPRLGDRRDPSRPASAVSDASSLSRPTSARPASPAMAPAATPSPLSRSLSENGAINENGGQSSSAPLRGQDNGAARRKASGGSGSAAKKEDGENDDHTNAHPGNDRPFGTMRPRSATRPLSAVNQSRPMVIVSSPLGPMPDPDRPRSAGMDDPDRPRSAGRASGRGDEEDGVVEDDGMSPRSPRSPRPPSAFLRRYSLSRQRSPRQRPESGRRPHSGQRGDGGSGSGEGSSDDGGSMRPPSRPRSSRPRSSCTHHWAGDEPIEEPLPPLEDEEKARAARPVAPLKKAERRLLKAPSIDLAKGLSRPTSACGCFTSCITPRMATTQFPVPPMPMPEELQLLPLPVLRTPELIPVPLFYPPEPAPVPEVPLPVMDPVPAFERLAPPPPFGFLGGKCPVFILDGSSNMSADFLMTFIDCILSPGGQLDISATHFDVIIYNKHAWSCHHALVKQKLLDPPEPYGNDLMPINRRTKSLLIEWLRSFSMVGSPAMHLGVQLGYSLRSADCYYMLTEGSALRPSAVLEVINSCEKKRPIFPLLLTDGRKEERFMEEIAALTGGKIKIFDKERFVKMYADYLAALGELPDPIRWIHERVVEELRANKEKDVFEELWMVQDRIEPEFNTKWAEPIMRKNAELVQQWHDEQDKAITAWSAAEEKRRAAALKEHCEAVHSMEIENAARQAEALNAHTKAKEEIQRENDKRSKLMVEWHEAVNQAHLDQAAERAAGIARYQAEVARVQAENEAILAAAEAAWELECREVAEYNKALVEKKKVSLEGDVRRVKRFNEDLEDAYLRRCEKVKAKNVQFIAEAKAAHERWCREIQEENERAEANARRAHDSRAEMARIAYEQKLSRWETKLESIRDNKVWSSESRWEAMYEIPERNREAREAARVEWATECHHIDTENEAALIEAEKEYARYKAEREEENRRRREVMEAYEAAVDAVTEENNRIMRKAEKRYQATCDRVNESNEHRKLVAAQSDALAIERVKELNATNHAAAYEEYLRSIEDLVKHNRVQQIRQLKNNYLMNELKRVEAFVSMSLIAEALATANEAAPPVAAEAHAEATQHSPHVLNWRADENGNYRQRHREHAWEGRPPTPGSVTSRTMGGSDGRPATSGTIGWGDDAHGFSPDYVSGAASPVHSACASPCPTPASVRVGPILASPMVAPKKDPPPLTQPSGELPSGSPLGSPVGPPPHRGSGNEGEGEEGESDGGQRRGGHGGGQQKHGEEGRGRRGLRGWSTARIPPREEEEGGKWAGKPERPGTAGAAFASSGGAREMSGLHAHSGSGGGSGGGRRNGGGAAKADLHHSHHPASSNGGASHKAGSGNKGTAAVKETVFARRHKGDGHRPLYISTGALAGASSSGAADAITSVTGATSARSDSSSGSVTSRSNQGAGKRASLPDPQHVGGALHVPPLRMPGGSDSDTEGGFPASPLSRSPGERSDRALGELSSGRSEDRVKRPVSPLGLGRQLSGNGRPLSGALPLQGQPQPQPQPQVQVQQGPHATTVHTPALQARGGPLRRSVEGLRTSSALDSSSGGGDGMSSGSGGVSAWREPRGPIDDKPTPVPDAGAAEKLAPAPPLVKVRPIKSASSLGPSPAAALLSYATPAPATTSAVAPAATSTPAAAAAREAGETAVGAQGAIEPARPTTATGPSPAHPWHPAMKVPQEPPLNPVKHTAQEPPLKQTAQEAPSKHTSQEPPLKNTLHEMAQKEPLPPRERERERDKKHPPAWDSTPVSSHGAPVSSHGVKPVGAAVVPEASTHPTLPPTIITRVGTQPPKQPAAATAVASPYLAKPASSPASSYPVPSHVAERGGGKGGKGGHGPAEQQQGQAQQQRAARVSLEIPLEATPEETKRADGEGGGEGSKGKERGRPRPVAARRSRDRDVGVHVGGQDEVGVRGTRVAVGGAGLQGAADRSDANVAGSSVVTGGTAREDAKKALAGESSRAAQPASQQPVSQPAVQPVGRQAHESGGAQLIAGFPGMEPEGSSQGLHARGNFSQTMLPRASTAPEFASRRGPPGASSQAAQLFPSNAGIRQMHGALRPSSSVVKGGTWRISASAMVDPQPQLSSQQQQSTAVTSATPALIGPNGANGPRPATSPLEGGRSGGRKGTSTNAPLHSLTSEIRSWWSMEDDDQRGGAGGNGHNDASSGGHVGPWMNNVPPSHAGQNGFASGVRGMPVPGAAGRGWMGQTTVGWDRGLSPDPAQAVRKGWVLPADGPTAVHENKSHLRKARRGIIG
eukprot:jgi/Mesvir1/5119/Mv15277-RA.1